MRSVVCVTISAGADSVGLLDALRRMHLDADIALVGSKESLSSAPADVAHVEVPSGADVSGEAGWCALRWALNEAYDKIISLQAHHPAAAVPAIIEALEEADAVVGSRFAAPRLLTSHAVSRLANLYAQMLLQLPVKDTTAALMGFKRHVLQAIHLPDLQSRTAALEVEVKHRVHRLGFRFAEIPIDGMPLGRLPNGREVVDAARRVLQLSLRGR